MLGSIAVIAAALVIRFTGWWPADPILAMLIGLWVLPRSWTLLSQSINILLEGVPEGLELQEIHDALAALPGVRQVHDLHVWALTSGRNNLMAHLMVDPTVCDPEEVRRGRLHPLRREPFVSRRLPLIELLQAQPEFGLCVLSQKIHRAPRAVTQASHERATRRMPDDLEEFDLQMQNIRFQRAHCRVNPTYPLLSPRTCSGACAMPRRTVRTAAEP